MAPVKKAGYAQVPGSDSSSNTTPELSPLPLKHDSRLVPCRRCRAGEHEIDLLRRDRSRTICILSLFTVLLSLNLAFATVFYTRSRDHLASDSTLGKHVSFEVLPSQSNEATEKDCIRRTSSFTPALDAIQLYETDFDNQFAHRSDYRGPPTVEREKAWLNLWHHEGIKIESWQMTMINRSNLELYEKVPPEKGDGYIALLEVHHQLHCLDLVRQYTWLLLKKYPEDRIPPDLREGPKANRMHVDHCIEALRLSIMCQGDMSPLLVTKDPNRPIGRRADFNTHHKCRNFTKLQEWTKAHGVEDWEKNGEPQGGHGHQ